ncbi:hypothetical protein ABHF33_01710 [Chitinibacter sp. FCG-7]|uniref:Uncharacterized protein n=1 Tax=Chitinibacter mangrovi TaxID=3153927 RepID=A0AAU7FAR9_9NEIS
MNKEISTYLAKCGNCKQIFAHPSLGDFAYGEIIFCSIDGQQYTHASAFSEFAQKISRLMPDNSSDFWDVIASLVDSIEDRKYSPHIHCLFCSSDNIEFWEGERIGVMNVSEASFLAAAALPEHELKLLVAQICECINNK